MEEGLGCLGGMGWWILEVPFREGDVGRGVFRAPAHTLPTSAHDKAPHMSTWRGFWLMKSALAKVLRIDVDTVWRMPEFFTYRAPCALIAFTPGRPFRLFGGGMKRVPGVKTTRRQEASQLFVSFVRVCVPKPVHAQACAAGVDACLAYRAIHDASPLFLSTVARDEPVPKVTIKTARPGPFEECALPVGLDDDPTRTTAFRTHVNVGKIRRDIPKRVELHAFFEAHPEFALKTEHESNPAGLWISGNAQVPRDTFVLYVGDSTVHVRYVGPPSNPEGRVQRRDAFIAIRRADRADASEVVFNCPGRKPTLAPACDDQGNVLVRHIRPLRETVAEFAE